ncbi:MAG: ComEC/Rec2 family competence protein [Candidatus Gracilibacteria bacterium]
MLSKNILFIFSSIFFLIGIFVNNLTTELSTSLLVLLILVVLFLVYIIIRQKYIFLLLLLVFSTSIGIIVSELNIKKNVLKENILKQYYDNKNHDLIFEIKNTNKVDEFKTEYTAKLIQIGNNKIRKNIKFTVKIAKNNEIKKGYIIKSNVKLYEFKDFNDFSYKKYMMSKNLFFSSNIYSYEVTSIIKLNKIEQSIINLRELFLTSIYSIYPKEEAIFLGGILIGARESLPDDLKQDFNNSGLTHFIAVSGFNITILMIFLTFLLQYFPVIFRVAFITLSIVLFTVLVGDTAPVIRASIMGLIGYYVLMSGRKGNILSIILLTLVVMIIISPLSINYDVSLHLSFFAVLGIIYTQKFFEKIFYFLPNILEIKTAFTLTLSALSFTLPIMILNFGQMSILAPFSNIAVTWTIPIAMLFGFISIIVYIVYPFAGIIVGYITWILLKWDIMVVHFFGKLEWSILKIDFGIYKYHLEVLYFLILIFLIIWFRKKEDA